MLAEGRPSPSGVAAGGDIVYFSPCCPRGSQRPWMFPINIKFENIKSFNKGVNICKYQIATIAQIPGIVGDDPLVQGQDGLVPSLQPTNLVGIIIELIFQGSFAMVWIMIFDILVRVHPLILIMNICEHFDRVHFSLIFGHVQLFTL